MPGGRQNAEVGFWMPLADVERGEVPGESVTAPSENADRDLELRRSILVCALTPDQSCRPFEP